MLLFERLMPDTWWCASGVQILCVSSFFPEGGFWLSVLIATQFFSLSESAWVWTDRLWKPKHPAFHTSPFALKMCCTQHVARMQHCMLQTADSARLKKCRVMMFTSGMLRDGAEIQRIFYFYFWKKIKRLKVMRLSDVLQSTLLLRPCSLISCFEDSRFASAAAFRCFSASFLSGLRPQILSTDVSSHFIQLHACNSLIAPYPYYWNVVWSSS